MPKTKEAGPCFDAGCCDGVWCVKRRLVSFDTGTLLTLVICFILTKGLHPGKLTWNIIMEVWKIIFLSKWVIYMFHVNLPGCTGYSSSDGKLPSV